MAGKKIERGVTKMKRFVLLLIVPVALLLGIQTATAGQKATRSVEANWNNFRAETLSGTISIVKPTTRTVFVNGPDNVSYKFLVTHRTKIKVAGTASSIAALASQTDRQVTITFVARAKGDVAHSITVSS